MCFIIGNVAAIPVMIEIMLLVAISCYKLYTLLFPFRARVLSSIWAKGFVIALWILISLYMIMQISRGYFAYFEPAMLTCEPQYTGLGHEKEALVFAIIFFLIPLFIIIFTNIIILCIAVVYKFKSYGRALTPDIRREIGMIRRISGSFPSKMAIITVSLVSWTFILSLAPCAINLIYHFVESNNLSVRYRLLQAQMYTINLMCNPVIYTATNVRFRNFIKTFIKKVKF